MPAIINNTGKNKVFNISVILNGSINNLKRITYWQFKCTVTFSICKVGDCGLQTYQTVTILKRATTVEFTTISPILYIHLKFAKSLISTF